MNIFEKIIAASLLIAAIASAALFGVWEDKVTLYAPLLVSVYIALAMWVARGAWHVTFGKWKAGSGKWPVESKATSNIQHSTTHSIPPGGGILLLFWLYSAVMVHFAVLPYEAKISTLCLGCYLAVYWASAHIFSRFSYRKVAWSFVFVMLVLTALYSLVQHKVAPDRIFGMERYTDYWKGGRLGGTYQCPNHIAHLFQMWLPFCLVFLFIPQFGWFWRICFAYALPLFGLLIYQTQSRAGILGAMAALGVTVLFMILRRSRRAFFFALLVVPLLGAGALGALWAGSAMFRARMQPAVKVLSSAVSGDWERVAAIDFRPMTWADTVVMIKDRPLFGFGPGNYGQVFEDYRMRWQGLRRETVHPHNEYLELTAEYGLVGAGLILCALISIVVPLTRFIRTSPRSYHALPAVALFGALAGTAVHGFFDFELHNFPNAMMLALLAGCTVAPLIQTVPAKHPGRNIIVRWVSLITVVLSALWSVQVMSSSWIRIWGDRLLQEQKFQKAEGFYKIAQQIDLQNWPAWLGLGQVYYHYRYNELDTAHKHEWALKEKEIYERAYRINTKKEEIVYGLGRVELFLGDKQQGLDHLRQAANYKRFNDFYWRKLGIELRKAGLYQEAQGSFEYAQKLDPSNPVVKRNIQWIQKRMIPADGAK